MRQLARFATIILLTLSAIFLVWQFRTVLLLIILSVIVAAAVRPIILYLVERGLSPTLSQVLVYLVVLSGLGTGLFFMLPPLATEFGQFSNWLLMEYQRWIAVMSSGSPWEQAIATQLLTSNDLYTAVFGNNAQLLFDATFGLAQGFVGLAASGLFILVLSIYWSIDQGHFERLWLSLLSVEHRVPARNGWRQIEQEIGQFARAQFTLFIIALCLLSVGFYVVGVRYPILLAILGALAWLLPVIGSLLIAVPAYLIGSLTSPTVATISVLYVLLLFVFLDYYLQPRLHNRQRYSSITVLVVMIPLVDVLGLIGFLIAPPIAITLQLISAGLIHYYSNSHKTAVQLTQIESRFAKIKQKDLDNPDIDYPPEINNILDRLHTLIKKAQKITQTETT